jgi:exodeoxyribonuclease V gamma subunit
LLAGRLQGRPTTANFRTGDLTVCTLVPMRSVPHRVVVLLGLDDGDFPRHPEPDGDDLLAERPEVGDRDPRSEDRQLLLDALMAATDHLVVTYSGRDERTNRPRPPAVPVAGLLDLVDATFCRGDGDPARRSVMVEHPLHSFDRRNFAPGGPGGSGPWGFDPVDLEGARASCRQLPAPPWLPGRLPPLDEAVVALDELVRFLEHPVRAFLRRRLGLFVAGGAPRPLDSIPLELDGLGRWALGDRLLAACSAGVELSRAVHLERLRGLLPPGALADGVLAGVVPEVEGLLDVVGSLGLPQPVESHDIRVELPDGRQLFGTVAGVRGSTVVSCTYSRLSPKHRLAAWARFLALSAAYPELAPAAVSIGRGPGGSQSSAMAVLPPLAADAAERAELATAELAGLVGLYDLGLASPLPLACRTSAAWATTWHRGTDPDAAQRDAREAWEGGQPASGERDEPEHVEVFGAASSFEALAATTDFEVLATRLWGPLLARERNGPAPSPSLGGLSAFSATAIREAR